MVAPINEEDPTEAQLIVLCAVAAFNLGLAFHTQSFVDNKDKNRLVRQAKDFYMQGHDLLDKLDILQPDGTWIQVFLAICNNLAEVCAKLQETGETHEWQQSLQQCFWTVPPMSKSPIYRHFSDVSTSYGVEFEPIPEDSMMQKS